MAVSGNTLLVAGTLGTVGGQPHSTMAAIDALNGQVRAWDPGANALVAHLATSGGIAYVSGNFSVIGGQTRAGLAALDLNTAAATSWNPGPNNGVAAFAVSGSTVYVGGSFTHIGGQSRAHLAALDASTGQATSWNPSADGTVVALSLAGSRLYVGGYFYSVAGVSHRALAAVDVITGELSDWEPVADNTVLFIAARGQSVFVAGLFQSVGGRTRKGLAAIDIATDEVTPWNPCTSCEIVSLAATQSAVYVGGEFSTIGGGARANIACVDSATGNATPWDPGVLGPGNPEVTAMTVGDSIVYLGGRFDSVGGLPRANIAAVGSASGGVLDWNPGADAPVVALTLDGGLVYASGFFSAVGGQSHLRVAAIDQGTGAVQPWDPGFPASASVFSSAAGHGKVFLGGYFSAIGSLPRASLAAIDSATHATSAWAPVPTLSNVLVLASGEGALYAGGAAAASPRPIDAIDPATGALSSWAPRFSSLQTALEVHSICTAGQRVFVSGTFDSAGFQPHHNLAALSTDPLPPSWASIESPVGGDVAFLGSTVQIRWSAVSANTVHSADLYLSRSGPAGPWELLAAGIAGANAYAWSVTGPEVSNSAYLRLDVRDWSGSVLSIVSPSPFSIRQGNAGVPIPSVAPRATLGPVSPDPARGIASVWYSLPQAAGIQLDLYDLQGRHIAVLATGERSEGAHREAFDANAMPSGVYFVRLRSDRVERWRRTVILR